MPIKSWSEFKQDAIELFDLKLIKKKGIGWFWRNFQNLIDDYPDYIKERMHGAHLPFGLELNISFLMKNRKTTWDIIRKRGDYPNEDPEDL